MYGGKNKRFSVLKCHIFIYFVYVWVGGVHAPGCKRVGGWCERTMVHMCGWVVCTHCTRVGGWCAYTRVHTCECVVCMHRGAHVEVKGQLTGFILLLQCGSQRPLPSSDSVTSALTCWAIMPAQVTGFKGQKKKKNEVSHLFH